MRLVAEDILAASGLFAAQDTLAAEGDLAEADMPAVMHSLVAVDGSAASGKPDSEVELVVERRSAAVCNLAAVGSLAGTAGFAGLNSPAVDKLAVLGSPDAGILAEMDKPVVVGKPAAVGKLVGLGTQAEVDRHAGVHRRAVVDKPVAADRLVAGGKSAARESLAGKYRLVDSSYLAVACFQVVDVAADRWEAVAVAAIAVVAVCMPWLA